MSVSTTPNAATDPNPNTSINVQNIDDNGGASNILTSPVTLSSLLSSSTTTTTNTNMKVSPSSPSQLQNQVVIENPTSSSFSSSFSFSFSFSFSSSLPSSAQSKSTQSTSVQPTPVLAQSSLQSQTIPSALSTSQQQAQPQLQQNLSAGKRRRFTEEQRAILYKYFKEDQYPDSEMVVSFSPLFLFPSPFSLLPSHISILLILIILSVSSLNQKISFQISKIAQECGSDDQRVRTWFANTRGQSRSKKGEREDKNEKIVGVRVNSTSHMYTHKI